MAASPSKAGASWSSKPNSPEIRYMSRALRANALVKCYLLVVVAFALLCASCGRGRGGAQSADLALLQRVDVAESAAIDTIDFGAVRTGEVVVRPLALTNGGGGPVVIVGDETSCSCLEMAYPKEPLAVGATVEARLTFYSSGYNFFAPRSFYLKTSASQEPKRLVVTAKMVH